MLRSAVLRDDRPHGLWLGLDVLGNHDRRLPTAVVVVIADRLAGEIEWRPFLGAWGLTHLPIAFDPA